MYATKTISPASMPLFRSAARALTIAAAETLKEFTTMRSLAILLLLAASPLAAKAQVPGAPTASSIPDSDWRVTVTVFRSPGTGIQVSKGHLAGFVGHYPTVIRREGSRQTTHFLRVGMAYYGSMEARTTPYFSLSIAPSLTRGWSTSAIVDAGLRHMFGTRFSGQLGVAVLHAPHSKETRVNPTVGAGVRF